MEKVAGIDRRRPLPAFARETFTDWFDRLQPWVARGVPIVGLEPSCLLTIRDEWVELLRTDAAREVARASFLLEEFLLRERARGLELRFKPGPRKALLHGHCHQKAMVGTAPTVAALV